MWDAPDYKVPYDVNFIAIFDHAHQMITKLPLAFLTLYQHAKKSAHFIYSLSWDTAEFHDLKGHVHAFMEIMQIYVELFWVLWVCLVTLTKNDSITLLKTSMFICKQKINFIIHFFFTILHFKESCNFIFHQHFGP